MRGLAQSDITIVARLLIGLPEVAWEQSIRDLLDRAHAADLYRKRLGRLHPLWGNGTLAGAAQLVDRRAAMPPEPFLSDRRFFAALGAVIDGVMAWRVRT